MQRRDTTTGVRYLMYLHTMKASRVYCVTRGKFRCTFSRIIKPIRFAHALCGVRIREHVHLMHVSNSTSFLILCRVRFSYSA